jgi:hypothetical protein
MDFTDLKPGDEMTVTLSGSKTTCRAQVRELHPGFVIGVLWNSIAQRWNNRGRGVVIKPLRVVAYHGPK